MSAPQEQKQKTKITSHSLLVIALILIGCGLIYRAISLKMQDKPEVAQTQPPTSNDCPTKEKPHTIADSYLRGIVKKGETVTVAHGFYDCNPVQRGDLVLLKISDKLDPVVKIARAIPGDVISLSKNERLNRYEIQVNGEDIVYRNSRYYFGRANGRNQIRLYQDQYNGAVQANHFILFSLIPPGLQDSGTFGVVNKKDLLGKVLLAKEDSSERESSQN